MPTPPLRMSAIAWPRRAARCRTKSNEPIVQKQEADAQPIIYLAFSSDRHSLIEIADFANRVVKDRVQTIPGVAQAQVYGNRYAMRVWLDPRQLAGVSV